MTSTTIATTASWIALGGTSVVAAAMVWYFDRLIVQRKEPNDDDDSSDTSAMTDNDDDSNQNNNNSHKTCQAHPSYSVLPAIRNRRSIFPKDYDTAPLSDENRIAPAVIQSLLDAALWAPFHGKFPAQFVVLGKESMVEMQELTLQYYDDHWQDLWPSCPPAIGTSCSISMDNENDNKTMNPNEAEYRTWRQQTQDEITGRWGPVQYMIAIVMRRQAHPAKRLPEWEEVAATACAVQNMHLQASAAFPHLACYWSSWHDAARDSQEMKDFLKLSSKEDKCLGFFMVAPAKPTLGRDRRKRHRSILQVEWRN